MSCIILSSIEIYILHNQFTFLFLLPVWMFRLRKTLVGTKSQLFTGTPLEGSTLSEMKMKPVVVLHKCIKHSVEQKRHKMSISSQQKRRKINNWGCPLPTVHIAQVASKSTHWEFLGKMPSKGIWRYKIPVEQCSRIVLSSLLKYFVCYPGIWKR